MSDVESELQVQLGAVDASDLGGNENDFPSEVVIIPIMNSPIFPGMIAPIILTEDKFTPELDDYLLKSGYVALNLVKSDLKDDEGEFINEEELDIDNREIRTGDIYKVGLIFIEL